MSNEDSEADEFAMHLRSEIREEKENNENKGK